MGSRSGRNISRWVFNRPQKRSADPLRAKFTPHQRIIDCEHSARRSTYLGSALMSVAGIHKPYVIFRWRCTTARASFLYVQVYEHVRRFALERALFATNFPPLSQCHHYPQLVLFNAGQPLVISTTSSQLQLAYLSTANVMPLLGPQPFFGQAQEVGAIVTDEASSRDTARHHPQSLPVSFLGMHEQSGDDGSSVLWISEFSSATSAVAATKRLGGIPYFAMDAADLVSWEDRQETLFLWVRRPPHSDTHFNVFYSKGLHKYAHPRTGSVVNMLAVDETDHGVRTCPPIDHKVQAHTPALQQGFSGKF
jgi:hypothetical protein